MKRCKVDEKYMSMAIELAKKAKGLTSPNPLVGCVIVKNGRVVSKAYHQKAGLPHAEARALKIAGKRSEGSTLYCNLEACSHYGKTPPCTKAIIAGRVKRAVFAMKDPNPINRGKGIKILKKAGIATDVGVLEESSKRVNRHFTKFIRKGLPYVIVKLAQSLDGKIADSRGDSKWISKKSSRDYVQKLRYENDAIMIGVNTLLKDNPRLTARMRSHKPRQKLRVIVDTNLRTSPGSNLLKNRGGDIIIAAGEGASIKRKKILDDLGVRVIFFAKKNGKIDLTILMKHLASMGIMTVLCEGGGELFWGLLREGLVDEVIFFISPRIIGGRLSPTSCGGDFGRLSRSFWIKNIEVNDAGGDLLIRGAL